VSSSDRGSSVRREWEQAVSRRAVDDLTHLLAAGADIDSRDGHGQTALMRAAVRGQREVVGWLVEQGAFRSRPARSRHTTAPSFSHSRDRAQTRPDAWHWRCGMVRSRSGRSSTAGRPACMPSALRPRRMTSKDGSPRSWRGAMATCSISRRAPRWLTRSSSGSPAPCTPRREIPEGTATRRAGDGSPARV